MIKRMRTLMSAFLSAFLAVTAYGASGGSGTPLPDCGLQVKSKLSLVDSLPQGCESEKQELRSLCSVALHSCATVDVSREHLQNIYQQMDEAAVLVAQCLGE